MIQQIDKDGNVIREWSCGVSDIAREIGCNRSVLQLALSGKRPYCKGYKWKSATDVATDDATPPIEDATTDILDATDATDATSATDEVTTPDEEVITETRSLPARLSIDWFMDINTDYKDEPQRTIWNVNCPTKREWEYIDWVWDKVSHLPRERRVGGSLIYRDKNELEGNIANHLKGGYKNKVEPANTIRRACELELLDLYMDKELQEFKQRFNK